MKKLLPFLTLVSFACFAACKPKGGSATPSRSDSVVGAISGTIQDMGNGALWTGYYYDTAYYRFSSGLPNYHHLFTDTTFAIRKVDDSTISVAYLPLNPSYGTVLLKYHETDSVLQRIKYTGGIADGGKGTSTILYFYRSDSLVFDNYVYIPMEAPRVRYIHLAKNR